MDLVMLAMTGGIERTEQQYRELLEAAGFCLERLNPTSVSDIHIIEAAPIRRDAQVERDDHNERDQQQPATATAD
jgi:hypothetical protein